MIANTIGICGGLTIAIIELKIPASLYIQKSLAAIKFSDVIFTNIKAIVFSIFIVFNACLNGLSPKEGTTSIRTSVTKTVVGCSVFIMLADVVITKLGWILQW